MQPSAEIDRQAETRGSVSLITSSQYLLHKLRYAPLAMRRRRSAIKKNGSSYQYFRAMIHNRKLVISSGMKLGAAITWGRGGRDTWSRTQAGALAIAKGVKNCQTAVGPERDSGGRGKFLHYHPRNRSPAHARVLWRAQLSEVDCSQELALLKRWEKSNFLPWKVLDLVDRLAKEFRAYEIPLTAITADDYANDEEVREDLIYKLFTITHPDVLSRIYSAEELEMKNIGAEAYDEGWQNIFVPERTPQHSDPRAQPVLGDASWLAYNLLNIQHSTGQRSSIVLEQENGLVTGAKVYGMSEYLGTFMTAVTGFRESEPGDDRNYYSMITGDVNDESFMYYLECLALHGFI